jgi:hypothetical protein
MSPTCKAMRPTAQPDPPSGLVVDALVLSGGEIKRGAQRITDPVDRRNEVAGTWSVIAADGKSGNWIKKFGLADDHEEANGEQVLTFWQAQERARKLARGGKNADQEDDVGRPVTLREALDAYQADLIARGGDVHNVARVRGHLSNTLSAKTVALLTGRELRRFRDNLLAKKLRASSRPFSTRHRHAMSSLPMR